jgi:hypothetical protein
MCWLGNAAEDLGNQGPDGVEVCGDGRNVELGALGTLARRIVDAPGGAADERNGSVPASAEPGERDQAKEVAEVQV